MPYQIKNGIIYSGNAVTLTQAQYDALTTTEKNNGTVYYIYDSDAMIEAQEVGLDGGNVETLAGSVATFESSPSTAVHDEGEYILYQAQLYKVTSAIAVGEDLTVGSNIEATNLGNELNNGLSQKYSFDNSYYLAGTTASANVTLNKTLSEINTFLVVFMGDGYVTRATNTVPACLLIQYPSVTHQFNIYLGGRSFVQMNRVDDTHVRIENSLDGTYCDRVYLLWA